MEISGPSQAFSIKWPSLYSSAAFKEQITTIHAFYSIRWQLNESIHFILDQNGVYTDNLGFALGSNKVMQGRFRFRPSNTTQFFVASTDQVDHVFTIHRDSSGALVLTQYQVNCDQVCEYKFLDSVRICQASPTRVMFAKLCQTNVYWNIFNGFIYGDRIFLFSHSLVFSFPTAPNNVNVQVESIKRRDFFKCKGRKKGFHLQPSFRDKAADYDPHLRLINGTKAKHLSNGTWARAAANDDQGKSKSQNYNVRY